MADPFVCPLETVDQALVIACSRRTRALQELDRADAAIEQAEQALMRAEQEKLLRERHVGMCDRSIDLLLAERTKARKREAGALV